MKNWYLRHQQGAYYLWVGLGLLIYLTAGALMLIRTRNINLPLLAIPFVLWILVGIAIFGGEPFLRSRRVISALNDGCDPRPLLDWADGELAYWSTRWGRKNYLNLCAMNRAVALHALGRNEEALAAAPEQKALSGKGFVKPVYFLNMAIIQLALLRPLVATQYVRQAEKSIAALPQGKPMTQRCVYSLESIRCSLLLADKKTAGLRERLDSLLERASTEYQRVCLHCDLARLAQLENRPTDARLHLEYVVDHGNYLAIRNEAQSALKALAE